MNNKTLRVLWDKRETLIDTITELKTQVMIAEKELTKNTVEIREENRTGMIT